jgi:hypothetical protein
MRILGVMLLVLLAGWTAAPLINPPPQATTDRSWVPSDAVIYGVDPVHGFFRFALNQAQQETLASGPLIPEELCISPDKSKVFTDSFGPGVIYSTRTRVLHDLGPLIAPYSLFPQISPDWRYIAWSNSRDPGVHIIDLHSYTMRTFHLSAALEKNGLVMVGAWSADGSVLITRRPMGLTGWSYWKMDPMTGAVAQIESEQLNGYPTYVENGQPIGVYALCNLRPVNQIATPTGALVYISADHDLVVKDPDGTLNVVAKHIVPPPTPTLSWPGSPVCGCGGPRGKWPALLTIFDDDVVLYSFGNFDSGEELFVYGIAEHKISQLGVAPIELVF